MITGKAFLGQIFNESMRKLEMNLKNIDRGQYQAGNGFIEYLTCLRREKACSLLYK